MQVVRATVGLWLAAFCAAAVAQTQVLPDFTRLVEEQGNAVVNISTTQAVRRSALPQVPGIEDEEIQEFFRRFIPRQPGPGQPQPGPARAARAARSARASSSAQMATSSPMRTSSKERTRSTSSSPTSAS